MGRPRLKMIKCAMFCFLLKILTIQTAVISNSIVEKCLTGGKTLLSSHLLTTSCCLHNKTDWLVRDSEGEFRCQENQCQSGKFSDVEGFPFESLDGLKCVKDVFEQTLCGEEAVGERLFVREDGVAYCDCDEDWIRFDGRCHQQFTPAFCLGENQILQLNTKPSATSGGYLLEEGVQHNFSCVENPCKPSFFPHRSSWIEGQELSNSTECYQAMTDLAGCEVMLGPEDILECCTPANRTICINGPQLVFLSTTPIVSKACKKDWIWSKYRDQCIKTHTS